MVLREEVQRPSRDYVQTWLEKWRGCVSVASSIWQAAGHSLVTLAATQQVQCATVLSLDNITVGVEVIELYVYIRSTPDVPYSKMANRCHCCWPIFGIPPQKTYIHNSVHMNLRCDSHILLPVIVTFTELANAECSNSCTILYYMPCSHRK
jgi:hypothetical protein